MSWREIRPVALGVVCRGEELLLAEHRDPTAGERFYRPLGGAIEFGERGEAALRREFREELGVELAGVEYVETYERVFTFDGTEGHELQRVYEADIVEAWPYERERFEGEEPELGETFPVVWKEPAALGEETVYPPELLD
ncbi:MAG: NUDIX domain-containing protein [Halobacteriaceae archaeon]